MIRFMFYPTTEQRDIIWQTCVLVRVALQLQNKLWSKLHCSCKTSYGQSLIAVAKQFLVNVALQLQNNFWSELHCICKTSYGQSLIENHMQVMVKVALQVQNKQRCFQFHWKQIPLLNHPIQKEAMTLPPSVCRHLLHQPFTITGRSDFPKLGWVECDACQSPQSFDDIYQIPSFSSLLERLETQLPPPPLRVLKLQTVHQGSHLWLDGLCGCAWWACRRPIVQVRSNPLVIEDAKSSLIYEREVSSCPDDLRQCLSFRFLHTSFRRKPKGPPTSKIRYPSP